MATYQITHVHVAEENTTSAEKITHVKIKGDQIFTVKEIINFIQTYKHNFFYTTSSFQNTRAFVEVARSAKGNLYIRTKANNTVKDNLLNLPHF